MSTKIYNGLKIKNMTLFEMNEFLRDVREKAMSIQEEHYKRIIVEEAVKFVDYAQILSEKEIRKEFMLRDGLTKFRPLIYLLDRLRKSDYEYEVYCKLILFPIEDSILCIAIGHEIFMPLFYEKRSHDTNELVLPVFTEFEEYAYYNNSDEPDNVTVGEWDKRKTDWETALQGIGIFSENGIMKTIAPKMFNFDKLETTFEKVKRYELISHALMNSENSYEVELLNVTPFPKGFDERLILSDEDRLKRLRIKCFYNLFDKYCEENQLFDKLGVMDRFHEFDKFKKEDANVNKVETILAGVKLTKLTAEDLSSIDISGLYKDK